MSLSNADLTHLLLALVLLLVAAHGLGWLCTRLRQPRVAGSTQSSPAAGRPRRRSGSSTSLG